MEYFAFISGILYLILEIKQNKLMWLLGVFSAAAYIYVFAQSHLFAAMCLQIYYLQVSIYGFYKWKKDGEGVGESSAKATIFYRKVSLRTILLSALATLLIFIALLTFLRNMTGDPMPVIDALTTALSVIATLWLSKSYIHQWWIWIVVDALCVLLFLSQSLYLTALLYLVYTIFAFYGYIHWRKKGVLIT